ncbi:MAG: BLUF domain-containing protein [Alphaproteobacteria bacterium]
MLVHCLYASRPTRGVAAGVVDSILQQSMRNNPARGITGMLGYTDDVFVQLLEGGRDAVCDLFAAIVRDERHADVRLLVYEEIAERRFANWTMGQVNVGRINPAVLLRFSDRATLDPFTCSGRTTMALLDELIASGAVVCRS